MSDYSAKVFWNRGENEVFTDNKYSRGHSWLFDGGAKIEASSSPSVVPLPWSIEANVDPEEAFVASLSSCHMLFFLSLAAKYKYVIDDYSDHAVGHMAKNSFGKTAMTRVTLRPHIKFSSAKQPAKKEIVTIHSEAHEQCFIANSVTTEVTIEPIF